MAVGPDVSIIIVNWNTKKLLLQCLKPIAGQGFEVIVVDNASADGSAEACEEAFPEVRVIRNSANLGFSRANNVGAAQANGRALLFLNSDTIPDPRSVRKLLHALGEHKGDIVGARVVSPDGSIQLASARPAPDFYREFLRNVDFTGSLFPKYGRIKDYDVSQSVGCVFGASMMMTRGAFDVVGGWPEDYFMYGEDQDICLNARRRGLTVFYLADAPIVHIGGASSKGFRKRAYIVWLMFKSSNKFLARNCGMWASLLHAPQFPIFLASRLSRAFVGRLRALLKQKG